MAESYNCAFIRVATLILLLMDTICVGKHWGTQLSRSIYPNRAVTSNTVAQIKLQQS